MVHRIEILCCWKVQICSNGAKDRDALLWPSSSNFDVSDKYSSGHYRLNIMPFIWHTKSNVFTLNLLKLIEDMPAIKSWCCNYFKACNLVVAASDPDTSGGPGILGVPLSGAPGALGGGSCSRSWARIQCGALGGPAAGRLNSAQGWSSSSQVEFVQDICM